MHAPSTSIPLSSLSINTFSISPHTIFLAISHCTLPAGMHRRSRSFKYLARGSATADLVLRLANENAVVVFSKRSCFFCHAVKQLFSGMAVNSMVYELDEYPRGKELERALMRLLGGGAVVPVVFVGGKLVGGIERVIGSHIDGTLVPLLKEAGALWL